MTRLCKMYMYVYRPEKCDIMSMLASFIGGPAIAHDACNLLRSYLCMYRTMFTHAETVYCLKRVPSICMCYSVV